MKIGRRKLKFKKYTYQFGTAKKRVYTKISCSKE